MVTAIVADGDELVRLEVDGEPCVAYRGLTGPVEVGDDVVLNVQAVELGLGSGGFHVLYANLTRGLGLPAAEGAHVMKLPYTPLQHASRHGEEDSELPASLGGMPVVSCSLHSQVAPVCAALSGLRVAYVQLQGGALPIALSDTVRALRSRGLVEATVGVGACFGGDVDCLTPWSALGWARAGGFDVVVCAIGPGVAGTASRLGHGGLAAATAAGAALALGGTPIVALRVSDGDPRPRHRGLSHHSRTTLELVPAARAAWPAGYAGAEPLASAEPVDASGWQRACDGLELSHMGRGPDDDPWFFAAAYAAGLLAREVAKAHAAELDGRVDDGRP